MDFSRNCGRRRSQKIADLPLVDFFRKMWIFFRKWIFYKLAIFDVFKKKCLIFISWALCIKQLVILEEQNWVTSIFLIFENFNNSKLSNSKYIFSEFDYNSKIFRRKNSKLAILDAFRVNLITWESTNRTRVLTVT